MAHFRKILLLQELNAYKERLAYFHALVTKDHKIWKTYTFTDVHNHKHLQQIDTSNLFYPTHG